MVDFETIERDFFTHGKNGEGRRSQCYISNSKYCQPTEKKNTFL